MSSSSSLPMEIEESAVEEEAGTRVARPSGKTEKQAWPKTLSEQVEAVRGALESSAKPITAADLARQFMRSKKDRIAEILETLAVVVDAEENCYITGSFSGTCDFGWNTGSLTSTIMGDTFIRKYDVTGRARWSTQISGTYENSGGGRSIAVDKDGNLYVTGSFGGFLAKHDSVGNLLWLRKTSEGYPVLGSGIAVDKEGIVYVTGHFFDTATFGDISLTSRGGPDIFVAKYDSKGNFVSAIQAGGPGYDTSSGIAFDDKRNVYWTGAISDIYLAKAVTSPVFPPQQTVTLRSRLRFSAAAKSTGPSRKTGSLGERFSADEASASMSYAVKILTPADIDTVEAALWYGAQAPGLGAEFIEEVNTASPSVYKAFTGTPSLLVDRS